MAFPTVRTTNTTDGSTAATDPVINLPGTLTAGDTMLMLFRKASGTQSAPTDWTEILNSTADSSDDSTIVAWKKVTGSEGSTATMTSGSASEKFAAAVWQIQGAADPDTNPPELTPTTGSSTTPDPPSHTPAAGAKDYLWFALGGWDGEPTSPPTYPTNYTNDQLAASSGTVGIGATNLRVAGASRQSNATSEDPDTFTIDGSRPWTTATVAVHPSAGGGGTVVGRELLNGRLLSRVRLVY